MELLSKIITGIILFVVGLPIIILLLRIAAGFVAFAFLIAGIWVLTQGSVLPGIGMLVIAGLIGIFAPEWEYDKWNDEWRMK